MARKSRPVGQSVKLPMNSSKDYAVIHMNNRIALLKFIGIIAFSLAFPEISFIMASMRHHEHQDTLCRRP